MRRHVLRYSILLACLLYVVSTQPAYAQGRPPLKDYIAPDELITMSSELAFNSALDIFKSQFRRFENKVLVIEKATNNPIGVPITNMYWKDAFEVVLRVNGFWYQETPDYVRVFQVPGGDGKKSDTLTAENAVNTREVEISAIFFEANRTEIEKLGMDIEFLTKNVGGWASGQGSNEMKTRQGTMEGAAQTGSGSSASTTASVEYGGKLRLSTGIPGVDIWGVLQALQTDNLGELISRPSITVRSEEIGRIQVGADISIRQKDFSGNTVEKFFSTGTIISVTPKVMKIDSIEFVHLLISAERSSYVPDPNTTIINKTLAETSVILLDQEETVVGGLFSNENTIVRRGVPWLRDLPWWVFGLKYLFGYDETQEVRKELIIILKARILPSLEDRLASKINEIKQGQKTLQKESERVKGLRRDLLQQVEAAKKKDVAE